MICRLCGRERGIPDKFANYAGPNVCMWTESAECESVRDSAIAALEKVRFAANTPQNEWIDKEIARLRGGHD